MENRPRISSIPVITSIIVLMLLLLVFFSYDVFRILEYKFLEYVIAALLGVIITTFSSYLVTTLNKNPTPLKVAVLGPPKAGKTVFLTILFDRIQVLKTNRISFQPYGRETIEYVRGNLNTLSTGYWLKPTSQDSVFFFRANATISAGFFKKKYTVEIGDYAGERVEEFDSTSEEWLHRTEFFKYVIGCDAVILAADGARILGAIKSEEKSELQKMENSLIAALQVLIDERGVSADQRLKMPVALVILKADLLISQDISFESAMEEIGRLDTLCQKKCRYYEKFFVSAIGQVSQNDIPSTRIEPINVCDPMVWILSHIHS